VVKALQQPGVFGGACCCGAAVGRRPTSLEADGVISVGVGEETRTNRTAFEGSAPHPPRSLSTVDGRQPYHGKMYGGKEASMTRRQRPLTHLMNSVEESEELNKHYVANPNQNHST